MLNIGHSKWKLIILSTICMCLFFSIQAYASQSVEQSARNAVEAFFNAALEKDFDTFANNSIDPIPLSTRHQMFDNEIDNFLGYQIKSVQKVDNEHATAIVEIREKDLTSTVKYPVIFHGKKWLVNIDNSENIAQYSSDGKKIFPISIDIQNEPPYSSDGPTVNRADPATQYGGILGNGYNMFVYSGSFNGPDDYVTIKGWQVPLNSSHSICVAYGLDRRHNLIWRTMNNFELVSGTYYPDGNWFERQFHNLDSNGIYRLVATQPTSYMNKPTRVAGNVYRS